MHIHYIEIANFRKLLSVRVDLAEETTVFAGANNSGKTSAMIALRRFMVEKGKRFRLQDLTLSHWHDIDKIGEAWEAIPDESLPAFSIQAWSKYLPALDIWLKVENDELHYVSSLLPSLDWAGGLLGVRMRMEPKEIEALYREYRKVMKEAKLLHDAVAAQAEELKKAAEVVAATPADDAMSAAKAVTAAADTKKLKLWPISLTDFLSRTMGNHFIMKCYLLDPLKIQAPVAGLVVLQELPQTAVFLDGDPLKGLIKVNEIDAQRGFGTSDGFDGEGTILGKRDGNKLSEQLQAYYTKHLDPFSMPDVSDLAALQAIEGAQEAFDKRLHESFTLALGEVEEMGYPGVSDPRLKFASKLKTTDGLDHEAAVTFEIQMVDRGGAKVPLLRLPETYNGLGYQNLISMIFRLMSYRDAWMRVGKAGKVMLENNIEPIHLVLVEEPEAHLHAQVQQVFIKKAYSVLRAHDKLKESKKHRTQLVVSSHSSHITHETSFACLRYFRCLPAGMASTVPVSTVVNLSQVFGSDRDTERFVTRYLRAHHCDLFYADAAILVEGPAEKMLIPNFIRRDFKFLDHCYITVLEINGSHSHKLKKLIDALGLLSLIITDIDAAEKLGGKGVMPERKKNQKTGNTALRTWTPKLEDVDSLLDASSEAKSLKGDELFWVRAAYQIPVSIFTDDAKEKTQEVVPSTFEDSLAFENLEFFSDVDGAGMIKVFRNAINERKDPNDLARVFFDALSTGDKAAFSLDVICSKNFDKLVCPAYISEGLFWLEARLKRKQIEILTEQIPVVLEEANEHNAAGI